MDANALQGRMWSFLEQALRDFGPRESCSPAERALGRWLAQRWRAWGWHVALEPFRCHPHAFLGFIPFTALFYFLSVAAYWAAPALAAVLGAAVFLVSYLELLRYRELLDPLFREREGENVRAVLPATGSLRQRVIVSAHRDSAYEFHIWYWFGNAAIPIMIVAFAAPLLTMAAGTAKALFAPASEIWWLRWAGYGAVALVPVVALNLFFHTYRVVPGAMDDLAGVAVLDGLAALLSHERQQGRPLLHTEVWLVATSAEEAGLRGAKRFASLHREDFHRLPTYGLFIDGVYDERHLTAVPREIALGTRHDSALVALAQQVAEKNGWPLFQHVIPFGATDASAFAPHGVRTVALLCQDATRLVPNYHTRLDTLDRVRPQSLSTMLQLVHEMIAELDRRATNA